MLAPFMDQGNQVESRTLGPPDISSVGHLAPLDINPWEPMS